MKEVMDQVKRYENLLKNGHVTLPARSSMLPMNEQEYVLCDNNVLWIFDEDEETTEAHLPAFRHHFSRGLPVVISRVTSHLSNGPQVPKLAGHLPVKSGATDMLKPSMWAPEDFNAKFGECRVLLVDCLAKPQLEMTGFFHHNFWNGFENFDARMRNSDKKSCLLKIKDWPAKKRFSEILPEHYKELMEALPINSYSNTVGRFNLASYLPERCNPPDLGPKMYIAYGSAGQPDYATTNLHLDISDAVNVIVHVGRPAGHGATEAIRSTTVELKRLNLDKRTWDRLKMNETPGAVWQIYRPEDADKIRQFIRKIWEERGFPSTDDPIHTQHEFLDFNLRARLKQDFGVAGADIVQFEGDAIFIPAGAPHQVWNIHSCIKVAEDFISPERVPECLKLTSEFRKLPQGFANKPDKLQLKNVLFHTVKKLLPVVLAAFANKDVASV